MKAKNLTTLLGIALVVLALVAPAFTTAWAQASSPKPMELSLALMMPSTHTRWTKSMAPWIKILEERAKGKIKIVPYFAASLAKGSEIYEAVSQGIADLGEVSTGHAPGRFRLTDFFQLPGLEIPDSVAMSRLHWHLIQTVPEFGAQYADTKVIHVYTHGGAANVIMSRKPIHTMEDLKGKKLNIYGGPIGVGIAKALGFTPIHMNIPDVYLAVEKGVMDGVISSVSLITSRKFGEITKHVTYGPTLGGAPFIFVMNRAKWNALPPDLQKVFDEVGGVYGSEFFGKGMVGDENEAKEGGIKTFNCEFYGLPPDELARWNKRLETVQEDWVKEMESKGLAARKVMEEYRRFVKMAK
ncbi:MAG: TRAP transporter substrate-binding protein [Pseudomonadota bacterium]